jgi:hypothetical protein
MIKSYKVFVSITNEMVFGRPVINCYNLIKEKHPSEFILKLLIELKEQVNSINLDNLVLIIEEIRLQIISFDVRVYHNLMKIVISTRISIACPAILISILPS